jgi:hypothetical protein
MTGYFGGTTTGRTGCVPEVERKDGMPIETEMIREALQLTWKRNMTIEMKASTRQQYEPAEMGVIHGSYTYA